MQEAKEGEKSLNIEDVPQKGFPFPFKNYIIRIPMISLSLPLLPIFLFSFAKLICRSCVFLRGRSADTIDKMFKGFVVWIVDIVVRVFSFNCSNRNESKNMLWSDFQCFVFQTMSKYTVNIHMMGAPYSKIASLTMVRSFLVFSVPFYSQYLTCKLFLSHCSTCSHFGASRQHLKETKHANWDPFIDKNGF